MLTHGFPAPYGRAGHYGARAIVFPLGGRRGMDQHGELTEVQEGKDRQGLERRDFRLLAVTSFPLSRGSACAFLTGLTGWRALIDSAVSLWTALPGRVLRMTASF